jgi:NADH-quinone oxidoreductase subunit L
MLMGISVGGVVVAILFAYFKYVKSAHVPVADSEPRSALAKISYNKFYFDEFYSAIIQKPLDALSSFFFKVIDKSGIDGIVNGLGKGSIEASKGLRLLQTGNVGFYIFAMVVGIVAVLLYSFYKF